VVGKLIALVPVLIAITSLSAVVCYNAVVQRNAESGS
jgi:hypothetical protein